MEKIVSTLVDYIWGNGLVYLALAVGLYFTIITRGVQFRYLPEMIRLLNEKQESGAGISSFQAFCMSLSGRIGVGNIAVDGHQTVACLHFFDAQAEGFVAEDEGNLFAAPRRLQ